MRKATTLLPASLVLDAAGLSCSDDGGADTTESPPSATTAPTTGPDRIGFQLGTCPEADPGVPLQCGTVAVPLHHDDPDGPSISIAVAVVEAAQPAAHAARSGCSAAGPASTRSRCSSERSRRSRPCCR